MDETELQAFKDLLWLAEQQAEWLDRDIETGKGRTLAELEASGSLDKEIITARAVIKAAESA